MRLAEFVGVPDKKPVSLQFSDNTQFVNLYDARIQIYVKRDHGWTASWHSLEDQFRVSSIGICTYAPQSTPQGDLEFLDRVLAEMKHFHSLRELSIKSDELRDQHVVTIRSCTQLTSLNLTSNQVSDTAFAYIGDMTRLEKLDVSSQQVTDLGVRKITKLRQLSSLDLKGNKITGEGMSKLPRLSFLKIAGSNLSLEGFAELTKCNRLNHLLLFGGQLTTNEARCLGKMPHLETLVLSKIGLTDAGLREICTSKSIETLHFSDEPRLTHDGLAALQTLGIRQFVWFSYRYPLPEGTLAKLAEVKTLETLRVNNIRLTDNDLRAVAKMTSLKRLTLYSDSMNSAECAWLKGQLPNTVVYTRPNDSTRIGN